MKASNLAVLVILCVFIPIYAYSQNYMDENNPQATPYSKEKSQEGSNLTTPAVTADTSSVVTIKNAQATQDQNTPKRKQIKAKSICIGEDCRSQWPVLKCADYGDRPAGETGDEYCGSINKTCMAVSIGGGQSFFGECSASVNSMHKCRCCWVE